MSDRVKEKLEFYGQNQFLKNRIFFKFFINVTTWLIMKIFSFLPSLSYPFLPFFSLFMRPSVFFLYFFLPSSSFLHLCSFYTPLMFLLCLYRFFSFLSSSFFLGWLFPPFFLSFFLPSFLSFLFFPFYDDPGIK